MGAHIRINEALTVREKPSLAKLFLAFLKLGATAFGGPAMVAYIRELAVKQKRWLDEESFQDGVALCQSIPGATAMQTAAYTGLRARGVCGAFAAYLGFGLPAFMLMIILAILYQRGANLQPVAAAFRGLQVIVIALLANAAFNFGKSSLRIWPDVLLAFASALAFGLGVAPFLVIGAVAVFGLLLFWRHEVPKASQAPEPRNEMRKGVFIVLALALSLAAGLVALFFLRPKLFDLAALLMRIDILAFGGGFASVPLMMQEFVERRDWLDAKTFLDGIALGQVTPGPIVITATFISYQLAGLGGALVGTIAVFSPSFLLVLLTTPCAGKLKQSRVFRAAMRGPLVSFVGLLVFAAVRMAAALAWGPSGIVLALCAFAALRLRIDILWVVLAGALLSCFIM